MIVNWVKEDEELLEPYEWAHGDDIEIISTLSCYKVDKHSMILSMDVSIFLNLLYVKKFLPLEMVIML